MTRLYAIHFSPPIEYTDVRGWADTSPLVETWRHEIPNCLFLASASSADDLARELVTRTGKAGRVLITELGANLAGWMTADFWKLVRAKGSGVPGREQIPELTGSAN